MSDKTPFPVRRFLAPRYWWTWTWLGFVRLLVFLPYGWQLQLGRWLGRGMKRLVPDRQRIAQINLELCFPELESRERQTLLHRHFDSLGMGAMEMLMAWWMPTRRVLPLGDVRGLEHLQGAHARGKGVILLAAHFTSLEITARLFAEHAPMYATYRPHKNALFDEVQRRARDAQSAGAIARGDIRGTITALRHNAIVWYAPDQDYGAARSVFVPFFGVHAATITATTKLARITGAAVVPFMAHRLDDGRGYRLNLLPALEDFPTGDLEKDALRVNRIIEDAVREHPEQYIWVHRRFKSRPPGMPRLYPKKKRKRKKKP